MGWVRVLAAILAAAAVAPPGEARDSSGVPPAAGIDLLRLIDPRKDAVAGAWAFDGTVLVSPALPFGRLAVPYVPPEEYDLRIVAERTGTGNSLSVGLVAGGRQILAILDGMIPDARSGLDLIDAKPFYDNETTHRGQLLKNGQRSSVLVSVRKDSLRVRVDGRRVLDWKVDPARISLWKDWKLPRADTLFLGAWSSPQRIHRLELIPLQPALPGKSLR